MIPGLGGTLRLIGRRDRVLAPSWLAVVALLPIGYATSLNAIYPDAATRTAFAHSTRSSAVQVSFLGQLNGDSLGALTMWRCGAVLPMVAIAVILTVVRHTRGEEESDRAELWGALAVSRLAAPVAAVIWSVACAGAASVIAAAGFTALGLGAAGACAWAVGVTGLAVSFAGITAFIAQLTANARLVRGGSFIVLALAYLARAIGDPGSGTVTWFSPLGWAQSLRPFADERWWAAAPLFLLGFIAFGGALVLRENRDLGAGLTPQRPGPDHASTVLRGPIGLAWRLQRGSLLGWATGLVIAGAVMGAISPSVTGQLDSERAAEIFARLGGADTMELAYLSMVLVMLSMAVGAYATSATLRLAAEESSGRADLLLARATSRLQWSGSQWLFTFGGATVLQVTFGLAAGIGYGATSADIGRLWPVLGAAVAALPAVWVIGAVAVLAHAVQPRTASVAWVTVAASALVFIVTAAVRLPRLIVDLDPFIHVPQTLGGPVHWLPLVVLTLLAAALVSVSLAVIHRRDII